MTDRHENWRRIEALLDRVLDLPADQIAAFLDEACAGDPGLRAEVESLLAADRQAPGFLDGDAADLVSIDLNLWGGNLEGETLGPWRVTCEIGRGGMSAVYVAERADGQFQKQVAIKVLRRDIASTDQARRFHRERQILASLDHPLIVGIQDGGITADGRPYLVMDYIEGERIDRHCDRLRLSVADRLRLFNKVLEAVQHAHRNLIVHRDIKPSNILINSQGDVRLLDFGIAKLLDADLAGSAGETRTGVRTMTPEYASPEQVRGEPVTTGTDIYALGVLLYELLTGHRPYPVADSTPYEIERAICESEPERPSDAVRRASTAEDSATASPVTPETISAARATVPAALRSTLDGDLDAIVLKALRKEPAERFGSAEAFAADIERYLSGHPVLARQGSRYYTLRKFVRRNRWPVALAAAVAGMLLGSTILISIEQARTQRAAIAAQQESETASQVTAFLIDLFGGSDPNETLGDSVSARVLLERGRERIDRELVDQPVVRASLLLAIGKVYSSLGRHDVADTLISSATLLRRDALGTEHEDVAEGFEALANNYAVQRDFRSAHGAFVDALTIRRALPGDQRSAIARNLAGLAYTHRDTGEPDSAYALMKESVDLLRSTGDTLSIIYLDRQAGLASMLRAVNRYDEAEQIYREVLPRLRELVGDLHPSLAINLNNLGFLLRQKGDFAGAADAYREAQDIGRQIFGDGHPQTQLYRQNLASALIMDGRPDEGIEVLKDRLAGTRAYWPNGDWRVGTAESGLGRALLLFGRAGEAETHLRAAETSLAATIGKDHSWTVAVRGWIAACAAELGRTREAATLFNHNLDQLRAAAIDGDVRASMGQLARHLDEVGLEDRAAEYRKILEQQAP